MRKIRGICTNIYFLAFIIPVVIIIFLYIIFGIYPFGDRTLLYGDLGCQYADYLSYLHEILIGKADYSYTFSKAIGGDMISVLAYYLMSPLNILFFLFDVEHIELGIHILMLLKWSLCSCSICIYLKNRDIRHEGKAWYILFFSLLYALSGYAIAYGYNIMWLDGMYMLPIVILGLERLLECRKHKLYILALAGTLIFNYYTGYMICLFIVFYSCIYYFFFRDNRNDKYQFVKTAGTLIYSSVLAIGLAAIILIPTAYSFGGNVKGNIQISSLLHMNSLFSMSEVWVRFLPGQYTLADLNENIPNIYFGVIGLIFFAICLCNPKMKWKEKTGYLLLVVILFLSFKLEGLNSLWHVCSRPAGIPNRFGFIWYFVIFSLLYTGLCRLELEKRHGGKVLLGIAGACWLCEMYINAGVVLYSYGENSYQMRQICTKKMLGCLNLIEEREGNEANEPYRIGTLGDAGNEVNGPFHFDYNSISSYTSSEKTQTKYIGGRLGYRNKGFWLQYEEGSTLAADSFMGIKYFITTYQYASRYLQVGNYEDYYIYENPYALPYAVWVLQDPETIQNIYLGEYDLFWIQNQIYMALSENPKHVLTQIPIINMKAYHMRNRENSSVYEVENGADIAYLEYELEATQENYLYVYAAGENVRKIEVENEAGQIREYEGGQIYDMGEQHTGERLQVRFYPAKAGIDATDQFFYCLDEIAFSETIEAIREEGITVSSTKDSKLFMVVENTADYERYLHFTIPAENGWHAYVDGEEVAIEKGLETFIMVAVKPGKHEVVLEYIMPGEKAGHLCSMLSLCIFGIESGIGAYRQRRKQK